MEGKIVQYYKIMVQKLKCIGFNTEISTIINNKGEEVEMFYVYLVKRGSIAIK